MTLEKLRELNIKLSIDLYPYGILFETGLSQLDLPIFVKKLLQEEQRNPNNDDKPSREGKEKRKNNPE